MPWTKEERSAGLLGRRSAVSIAKLHNVFCQVWLPSNVLVFFLPVLYLADSLDSRMDFSSYVLCFNVPAKLANAVGCTSLQWSCIALNRAFFLLFCHTYCKESRGSVFCYLEHSEAVLSLSNHLRHSQKCFDNVGLCLNSISRELPHL